MASYSAVDIAPGMVLKLGRRHDGVTAAVNPITVRPGEVRKCAFDCALALPAGAELSDMGDMVDDGGTASTTLGFAGPLAKFSFDASELTDGDDVVVSCELTTSTGETIQASGTIRIRA